MRIAVRVDASVQIGTGHLRRCLELARELASRGGEVTFVWRDLGLDASAMITAAGFTSLRLPKPTTPFVSSPDLPPHAHWAEVCWRSDAEDTISALSTFKPDVLIADHYALDHRWHGQIRVDLDCRMVAIDDLGDRALDVDLIVDHNYSDDHLVKHRISQQFRPTILGGPTYALLSAAYRERGDFIARRFVEQVGVFLGGTDPANHSELALRAVRRALGDQVLIEIATTAANPNLGRLRSATGADHNCSLLTDLPNLGDFFARHDLQIGAGGGATWERCCIGAPTVAIAFADNHRLVLGPLGAQGVLSFSCRGDEDAEVLAIDISALASDLSRRRAMSAKARRLVDGLGVVRVGEAIVALAN